MLHNEIQKKDHYIPRAHTKGVYRKYYDKKKRSITLTPNGPDFCLIVVAVRRGTPAGFIQCPEIKKKAAYPAEKKLRIRICMLPALRLNVLFISSSYESDAKLSSSIHSCP